MNLNATDKITIIYNFILVIFTFILRAKIAVYAYHLTFNLSVILNDAKLFERFVFQLSSLFYLCFLIFIFLPVEGPTALRNEYFHQGGLLQALVVFIYTVAEKPGASFPSSHVAAMFLVAWWGSTQFKRMKIPYWLTFLFMSIATVYCMFHYAVDVIGGLLLGVLAVFAFNRADIKGYSEETLRGTYREGRG